MALFFDNGANAFVNKSYSATLPLIENGRSHLSTDTLFKSASLENPSLSFQSLVYKRRLDSLQKSVSLDYNEHVQSYINIYLDRKEQIGNMLGLSKYYFPIFEKALKEAGLPDELKFLTVIESALNPQAVSKSGAVGPWQFMYTTAKGYGLVMDTYVDERKDPVKASYAAAHYFLDAYKRIGDWLLTIAAFNCGTGAVTRAIQRSGGVADFWKVRPFLPRETQNYVPAFIATVYAMSNYQNHNISLRPAGFNILTDVIPVNKTISISKIANAADLDLKELLLLNPSYKKQVVNGSSEFPKSLVIPGIKNEMYTSLYEVLNGFEPEKLPISKLSVRNVSFEVQSSAPVHHGVKAGQNLTNIANQYGVEVQDLKVWNDLKTSTVVPGQSLRISSPQKTNIKKSETGYLNYIVKVGDTLSEIADKFRGATVKKIKALNGLTRSTISPGMKLKINQS
jgi:membrane-bound lytic murein transglycosylase D